MMGVTAVAEILTLEESMQITDGSHVSKMW